MGILTNTNYDSVYKTTTGPGLFATRVIVVYKATTARTREAKSKHNDEERQEER